MLLPYSLRASPRSECQSVAQKDGRKNKVSIILKSIQIFFFFRKRTMKMVKQAKVLPSHIKQAKHDEIDEKKMVFMVLCIRQ